MSIDIEDIVYPLKRINVYFFLFGRTGQAYSGGWVKVRSETLEGAKKKFIRRFGTKCYQKGEVVCDKILTSEQFLKTSYLNKGYFGAYCHETI